MPLLGPARRTRGGMFKKARQASRGMQAGQEQKVEQAARRSAGPAVAATDGKAEFKERLVSLVDPAGLMEMERCGGTAALMESESSRAGYAAGVRMSRLWAAIFADIDYIAGMPVEDGVLSDASVAVRHMKEVLFETADAYRDGRDAEPIAELEEARDAVALIRAEADERAEAVRAAGGPPGAALPDSDKKYIGRACRDVIREYIERVRAEMRELGIDPIFPPKPRPIEECFGDADDPNLSVSDWLDMERGKGTPEGYHLDEVDDDGVGRQGKD